MGHTKALFFIYNHKTQVVKVDVLLNQAVRTNNNINLSLTQFLKNRFLLSATPETGWHLNFDGIGFKTFGKGLEMLLCQDGCWHQ